MFSTGFWAARVYGDAGHIFLQYRRLIILSVGFIRVWPPLFPGQSRAGRSSGRIFGGIGMLALTAGLPSFLVVGKRRNRGRFQPASGGMRAGG